MNLAKLDDGLDESPTDKIKNKKTGKNRCILRPSWAFVETNIYMNLNYSFFLFLLVRSLYKISLVLNNGQRRKKKKINYLK
jgi:hypothetical protein